MLNYTMLSSDDPGFTTLVADPNWTVGLVNYMDILNETKLIKRERHFQSDELFILTCGEAKLHIGEQMEPVPLEIGKACLIPKGMWHALSLSEDAKVFVVENTGTGDANSEKFFFTKD